MLVLARHRVGDARFVCADMRASPIRSSSCAGAVAFYSVQHVPRADLGVALGELRRVMSPAGTLVVATHLGEGAFVSDEFLGHRIEPVGGNFYGRHQLEAAIVGQGFRIDTVEERDPLRHEHPSRRIYVIAGTVSDR
jgi:ubiquinone/menaquinone biosynthesis C-methylase UbiE